MAVPPPKLQACVRSSSPSSPYSTLAMRWWCERSNTVGCIARCAVIGKRLLQRLDQLMAYSITRGQFTSVMTQSANAGKACTTGSATMAGSLYG